MRAFAVLAVLLAVFPAVLAASALERGDFRIDAPAQVVIGAQGTGEARVIVSLAKEKAGQNVFNLQIRMEPPPGVEADELAKVENIINKDRIEVRWNVGGEPGSYAFSDAFEIVSWDDSVQLELDEIPESTREGAVEISGRTDNASLCERHEFRGAFSEPANCNPVIIVNNRELGYANNDGAFSFSYSLEKGENMLEITARDPGGNTRSVNATISYIPKGYADYALDHIIIIAIIAFAALVLIALIFWRIFLTEKKAVVVAEEKKKEIKQEFEQRERIMKSEERERKVRRMRSLYREQKQIERKGANMPLTEEEGVRYEKNKHEILGLEDELFADSIYMKQLEGIADEALGLAREGYSGREVQEALRKEHTPREIEKILEIFNRKKGVR